MQKIKFLFHTDCKKPSNPGASIIQATIVPINNIIAYIIRVEVEFRHDGHAAQHNEQAALPQHHASCRIK